jgi:hypothetical protein
MISWTSLVLGLLLGIWLTYIALSILREDGHPGKVFSWGFIAVASSIMTKLLLGH